MRKKCAAQSHTSHSRWHYRIQTEFIMPQRYDWIFAYISVAWLWGSWCMRLENIICEWVWQMLSRHGWFACVCLFQFLLLSQFTRVPGTASFSITLLFFFLFCWSRIRIEYCQHEHSTVLLLTLNVHRLENDGQSTDIFTVPNQFLGIHIEITDSLDIIISKQFINKLSFGNCDSNSKNFSGSNSNVIMKMTNAKIAPSN